MFTLTSIQSFLMDIAVEYCLFLPLDVWTKYALRAHRKDVEKWSHIWLSEAQVLVVLCVLLFVWRGTVPWLLLTLACGAYFSSSPSSLASRLAWAWLKGTAFLGTALDTLFAQVFPRSQWGEAQLCAFGCAVRGAAGGLASSLGLALAWAWSSMGRWHADLLEGYEHHSDTVGHAGTPQREGAVPTMVGAVLTAAPRGPLQGPWPQPGREDYTPLCAGPELRGSDSLHPPRELGKEDRGDDKVMTP